MSSPRPVPRPTSLVVKNGSKARARTSAGMPGPLSATSTTTFPSSSTYAETVSVPSPPIASTALSTRLVQTWLSSPGIASIRGTPAAYSRTTRTPSSLCPSITRVLSRPSVTSVSCTEARSSWE